MSKTLFMKKPVRVLIADGDSSAIVALTREIRGAGYEIVAGETEGVCALHTARVTRPDVVILDAELPDICAIEASKILHDEAIAPSVILAADVTPDLVRKAARAMVFSVLVKPVQISRLVPAMEIAIGQWQAFTQLTGRLEKLRLQEETRDRVLHAKRLLMEHHGLSEPAAYRAIRDRSMSSRKPMLEIAIAIIEAAELLRPQDTLQIGSNLMLEEVA